MNKLKNELNGEPLWGLPKRISDELVDTHRLSFVRFLGFWMFMFYMVGGFAVGGWYLWPWLENQNNINAQQKAAEVGGLMYDVNFGIGLLIGLFVWIFTSSLLSILTIRLLPMPIKGALSLSMLADTKVPTNNDVIAAQIIAENPRIETAGEFLNTWANSSIFKHLKFLLPAILLTAVVTYREIQTFSVYGVEGVTRSAFFAGEKFRPWSEVKTVELGCNQTDDGGSFIYEVQFEDGKSLRIAEKTPVNKTHWLDNLEKIDAEISSGAAEFKRWKWLKRDPLHPKCLRGYYGELNDEDIKRFKKLLHVDSL